MSADDRRERPGAEGTPRCPANSKTSASSRKPPQPFVGDAAAENKTEQSASQEPGPRGGGGGVQEPAGLVLRPLVWDAPRSAPVRCRETLARCSAGTWAWASFWGRIAPACFPAMRFTLSPISLRRALRAQTLRMENENA